MRAFVPVMILVAAMDSAAAEVVACVRVDAATQQATRVRLLSTGVACAAEEVRLPLNVPGPKGPKGGAGDAGEGGERGPKGETGLAGAQGEVGTRGVAGAPGDKGTAGDPGPKGYRGDPGDSGPTGDPAVGAESGAILGRAMSCGNPLAVAMVYLQGRSHLAVTDAEGRFVLWYVPPGTYDVTIETRTGSIATYPGAIVVARSATPIGTLSVGDCL